mgnify:FL=1
MKKMIYMLAAAFVATAALGCPAEAASVTGISAVASVKAPKGEIKTVVFSTDLHCQKCVNKINDNLAFEKGVKDLKVDLKAHTITVKYDTSKTSVEKLAAAIKKLGYTATIKK